ncbi:fructose-specific PTS transporter subunit EIIC [Vaginisenegalia massiliensis]|uniref:fructose-specific PTS transporter subunit EIIC n=1 Tax=Vaginisenegalia massiliensis TaxID=2058294 RepID=UPI00240586B3|nr:fructose-specific PTS transporter subunit EIIC [Vaginisenegalia massiliensis]
MGFMVPILAGYIAYAIADRPGLVPGMVGGFIAVNGSFYGSEANTGFIGGIIAGFIAGYVALFIKKIKVPKAMEAVMPIIFIPVISSVIVGLAFIYLVGAPVAGLFASLTAWLASMKGASSILLAAILGAMIAVDMGGPFNKTAFLFAFGLITEGQYHVMGAVAVAICIPPIAMGLASHLLKSRFSQADRQAGTAALTMGLFGITEGAIPFAAKDPLRVIPSIVGGSMVGSVIAMLSGVGDHVAHGGPIVAVLGAVDNVFMFFVAVLAGVAVTILLLFFLKPRLEVEAVTEESKQETIDLAPQTESSQELSLADLTKPSRILMDMSATSKEEAFLEFLNLSGAQEVITDHDEVLAALNKREAEGTTGMGDGIAIPHAKSASIKEAALLVGKSAQGIEWASLDGQPAHLAFLILVPEQQQGDLHLKILQLLARKLMDDDFKQRLLNAPDQESLHAILAEVK